MLVIPSSSRMRRGKRRVMLSTLCPVVSLSMGSRLEIACLTYHFCVNTVSSLTPHMPCLGLINPKCIAFVGSGLVINIPSMFEELDGLESQGRYLGFSLSLALQAFIRSGCALLSLGLDCTGRLFISDRAHLVMGFHQIVDGLKEKELGGSR
jgi:adenylosuccinate synthase